VEVMERWLLFVGTDLAAYEGILLFVCLVDMKAVRMTDRCRERRRVFPVLLGR